MPDKDGKLSEEEQKKIQVWLNNKQKRGLECPFSGHNEWSVAEHLVAPWLYGTGYIAGNVAYPHAIVSCKHCGYTMHFNAVTIGVVSSDKEGKNG